MGPVPTGNLAWTLTMTCNSVAHNILLPAPAHMANNESQQVTVISLPCPAHMEDKTSQQVTVYQSIAPSIRYHVMKQSRLIPGHFQAKLSSVPCLLAVLHTWNLRFKTNQLE
jgi:hypothetical protein